MDNRNAAWLAGAAFAAGALLMLGFEDRRRRQVLFGESDLSSPENTCATGNEEQSSYKIPEGLQGSIGNTPLFKLVALSEATGCEIFVKAEV